MRRRELAVGHGHVDRDIVQSARKPDDCIAHRVAVDRGWERRLLLPVNEARRRLVHVGRRAEVGRHIVAGKTNRRVASLTAEANAGGNGIDRNRCAAAERDRIVERVAVPGAIVFAEPDQPPVDVGGHADDIKLLRLAQARVAGEVVRDRAVAVVQVVRRAVGREVGKVEVGGVLGHHADSNQ